jgi:hypothetical protein
MPQRGVAFFIAFIPRVFKGILMSIVQSSNTGTKLTRLFSTSLCFACRFDPNTGHVNLLVSRFTCPGYFCTTDPNGDTPAHVTHPNRSRLYGIPARFSGSYSASRHL